ncbi:CsbD family protein [Paraburkholderia dinghuensis]|nr:hypothetical protein [Paraburkholderia dinghuensis]
MNNDNAAGRWTQLIAKAKATWRELTDNELIHVARCTGRLAG